MKITKITVQKKNKSRFNVFIDRGNGEEFGFGIDEEVYIQSKIRKGTELTEKEVKSLQLQDQFQKGLNMAMNYLSYRMRSMDEIRQYLIKKEFEPHTAESVIERIKELGYLDDMEFSKMFIRSKVMTTKKGPKALKQDLKQKGVDDLTIENALTIYTEEEQVDEATKLVEKKAKQSKKLSEHALKQKIGQVLQQKGYAWSIIEQAIDKASLSKDEDEEREALNLQAEKANRKYKQYSGWEYKQKMKQFLYRKGFPVNLIDEWLDENQDLNDQ
ncbi:recombination regulator RecX [Pseudalkalibacillus berkeleyi]|uniref:Regulatory protein RecX n=1 Tax=Pseudalkalibacillus berkeleyi TaxID=1069813 RepID=A0ABS9H610_9BACL|nr:recombination regulator RecX [Pseudalkalibacillus berkeleyi]MCF6139308.1 recombination regulator RecX [Pseudalkalibacillus berkeleyi]